MSDQQLGPMIEAPGLVFGAPEEEVESLGPVFEPLEGPYQYHVYCGYTKSDKQLWTSVTDRLRQYKLLVYNYDPDCSHIKNIELGTRISRKAVLIVSRAYLEGKWFKLETDIAVKKAQFYGRDFLVLLLCGVSRDQLPDQLQKFSCLTYSDPDSCKKLVTLLAKVCLPHLESAPSFNIGYTLACSYFYGFLQIILPGLADQAGDCKYLKNKEGEIMMSRKLFVIIPEKCYVPLTLSDCSDSFSSTGDLVVRVTRSGHKGRPYSIHVYQIQDADNNKEYHATIEIPSSLATLKDMVTDPVSGINEEQAHQQVQLFYFNLKALLSHPDYRSLKNRVRLIYWSARTRLIDCVLPIISEEIEVEKSSQLLDEEHVHLPTTASLSERQESIYSIDRMEKYNLDFENSQYRGKAFIINNVNFTRLRTRDGAEADQESLKQLWQELHFEVLEYHDLTRNEIEDELANAAHWDYSADRAVIVCIMTHGKLGMVTGIDGEQVRIIDLVKPFADNYTLDSKPKIFFIQACQVGSGQSCSRGNSYVPNSDLAAITSLSQLHGPTTSLSQFQLTETQGDVFEDEGNDEDAGGQALYVPSSPDFFMHYSTLPGSVSFRHTEYGSFYIQAVCDHIRQYCVDTSLDDIMKLVTDVVQKKVLRMCGTVGTKPRQFPFHLHISHKKLYF